MSEEKGSPAPEMWHIVLLVLALIAGSIYVWYKHSKDANWNPYKQINPLERPTQGPLFP